MACNQAIVQCVMNNPTVAGIGLAAGFILAKALQMRKRNSMGMGGGF